MLIQGPPSNTPKLEKSLGHLLLKKLTENADKLYQIDPYSESYITQGEIKSKSIRVALQLQKLGLKKNDSIVIFTSNHKNTVLPFLAAFYLGVTVNPLAKCFNDVELCRLIKIVKPKMVLCDEDFVPRFKSMLSSLDMAVPIYVSDVGFEENFIKEPENLELETNFEAVEVDVDKTNLLVLCSSGTTGYMKGVQHTHNTFYHAVVNTRFVAKLSDIMFSTTNMAWNSAPWSMIYSILFATPRVPANADCSILDMMKFIKKYKATHLNITPAKLTRILHHPEFPEYKTALQNLRVVWSRGAANTETQMNFFRSQLPTTHIMNAIGTTETSSILAYFDSETEYELNLKKVYSNGKLCPGVVGKIMDPSGDNELGLNERGELWIKSEAMTIGYLENPEANASTFTPDGWYMTGDMAYFDADQCLYVCGRYKEIFKFESTQVLPSEIEYIINLHPKVQSSCVMGLPDELSGDLPMAFVIKKPDVEVSAEEIIKYVEEKVSNHERLRGGVRFVPSFPTTPSGKIRRFELKKLLDNNVN